MRKQILASVAFAALLTAPAVALSAGADSAADKSDKASSSSAATTPSNTKDSTATTGAAAGASGTTGSAAATSGMKSDASKSAAGASSGASVITAQQKDQLTADTLIGMNVRNPQDENIGKIEDLVLDTEMKVVGLVVSVGGFLGMGEHNVALQRDQVQITTEGDRNQRVATVSMTKEQLKAAPEFKTLDRQQAEAEQDRAKQSTAAGSSATRPMGSGSATPPPTKTQ